MTDVVGPRPHRRGRAVDPGRLGGAALSQRERASREIAGWLIAGGRAASGSLSKCQAKQGLALRACAERPRLTGAVLPSPGRERAASPGQPTLKAPRGDAGEGQPGMLIPNPSSEFEALARRVDDAITEVEVAEQASQARQSKDAIEAFHRHALTQMVRTLSRPIRAARECCSTW